MTGHFTLKHDGLGEGLVVVIGAVDGFLQEVELARQFVCVITAKKLLEKCVAASSQLTITCSLALLKSGEIVWQFIF